MRFQRGGRAGGSGRRWAGILPLWATAIAIVVASLPPGTATAQLNPLRILQSLPQNPVRAIEGAADNGRNAVSEAVGKKKRKLDPRRLKKGQGKARAAKGPFNQRVQQNKALLRQQAGQKQKKASSRASQQKTGLNGLNAAAKKSGPIRDARSFKAKNKNRRSIGGQGSKSKDIDKHKGLAKGKDLVKRKSAAKSKDALHSAKAKGAGSKSRLGARTNVRSNAGGRRIVRRTPAQRREFIANHRRALAALRQRLPRHLLPGQPGFTGVPSPDERRFVANTVVFQAGPNVSTETVRSIAQRHGMTVAASHRMGLTGGTIYQFRFTDGRSVADAVRALEAEKIGVAQPEYVYRVQQDPSVQSTQGDPPGGAEHAGDPGQYIIGKLHLEEVHRLARGDNVLVAVIDSKIDIKHPDLIGSVVDQYDAVGENGPPHEHGTGMVGAISAHHRLLGIAPDARILAVRAFSPDAKNPPQATTQHIIAGLDWAIAKGARIINMSFAGPFDPMLALAMKRAHDKGVVLIAAAGNAGKKSPPLYPAADPNVIAVTATDEEDKILPQAVRGPHVAVSAPGVDIMVPAPNAAYQMTTGTSVAAAHVSGVAALLLQRHPDASAETILEVLTMTAKKLDPKGRDDDYGWGLIDPAAAIEELDERMAEGVVATSEPVPLPVPRPAVRKRTAPRPAGPIQLVPRSASAR